MPGEVQFVVVTLLLALAIYLLVTWKNQTRADTLPPYAAVKTKYADEDGDLPGYSAAKQGRAFAAEGRGGYEGFSGEKRHRRHGGMVPIRPLGVVDPAESLAKMQKDESEQELRELQAIKDKQTQAAVNLLPEALDSSVVDLVNRNLLIASGTPQSGVDVRGASLRNASYDIRRQPVVERQPVSIWMNSNLDPPLYQKPLE